MIVAVALLPLIAAWVGISQEYLWLAVLYCTLLPTMGAATPSGVLRTLDRFDLLSWAGTVTPIARALLAGTAFAAGAPFPVYVGIWYATDLAGDLYTWFLAVRELRRRGLLEGIRPTLKPTTLPGAWRFAIHINLASSVRPFGDRSPGSSSAACSGPPGAALFRVASSLADSAQKPADLLGKAFYPEVVRMDLSSKKPWKLMLRGSVLAGGVALLAILILLLGGKSLISLALGQGFRRRLSAARHADDRALPRHLQLPAGPDALRAWSAPTARSRPSCSEARSSSCRSRRCRGNGALIGAAIAIVLGTVTNVAILMVQLLGEYRRVRTA